jgi:hypothetical protein
MRVLTIKYIYITICLDMHGLYIGVCVNTCETMGEGDRGKEREKEGVRGRGRERYREGERGKEKKRESEREGEGRGEEKRGRER